MENFALDATHKGGLTISHYLDCSPNVVSIFKEVNKPSATRVLSHPTDAPFLVGTFLERTTPLNCSQIASSSHLRLLAVQEVLSSPTIPSPNPNGSSRPSSVLRVKSVVVET